jgi:hypothetical protein
MQTHRLIPLLLAAAVALPALAQASGTYTARPPRPAVKGERGEKMDSEKYELGKRIYTGKLKLGETQAAAAAAQEGPLRELQGHLPEREQKKTNLSALAGKLSAEQIEALDYYIHQRFPHK